MADMYKYFAKEYIDKLDFGESALYNMHEFESLGRKLKDKNNGYLVGKHLMDLSIKMWKEDMLPKRHKAIINDKIYSLVTGPTLNKKELYEDSSLPKWFLDKVLK